MVRPILRHLGVSLSWYPFYGRDRQTVSSSCGAYVTLWDVRCTELTCGGPFCGEPSGGKWTGGRLRELLLRGLTLPSGALALRSDNTALPGFIARLLTAPARGAR